jgi:hypothetical protein
MCVMALGLIGGVLGAVGSLVGAQQQAQAANNQAAIYARQAAAERAQAEFNANQTRSKAIKVISQQRTGYLASGLSLEGAPTDTLADSTRQSELDVAAIRYNGEIKAQNFDMQAAAYRSKAAGAQTAGVFGAISPLIKGFGGATGGGGGDFSFGGSTSLDEG